MKQYNTNNITNDKYQAFKSYLKAVKKSDFTIQDFRDYLEGETQFDTSVEELLEYALSECYDFENKDNQKLYELLVKLFYRYEVRRFKEEMGD